MPLLESESIDASARGKAGADVSASSRVEIANRYYGLVKWICGGLILATVWVVTIQIDVNSLKQAKASRDTQVKALEIYDTANDKVIGQIGARIDQQRVDIDRATARIDKIEPEHQEMWFMKRTGRSNKEAYFQEHGYPANGEATSETVPKRP